MMKRGPWTILDSETKYKNPWMKVVEHKVIRPDSKEGIYGVVSISSGAYILPVDTNGIVYLTKQFRFPINAESIEAVSGGIDAGENPLDGAKRELKEELGIEAKLWTPLGVVEPLTSPYNGIQHMYLAQKLTLGESHQEGTESIILVKATLEECVQMVMESKIIDAPSCVLILKANEYLRK